MLSIQDRLDYMLYALDVYYSNACTVQCAHTHVLGGGCVIHYTFMTHLELLFNSHCNSGCIIIKTATFPSTFGQLKGEVKF